MRNCFKRYDKANGNHDFNSVGSSGAANTTGGGNAAATAGGAVAISSQPSSNTQAQQAPSPLTKSGGHHKSHKSITLTQQQMQNVRKKSFKQYSFLRRIAYQKL